MLLATVSIDGLKVRLLNGLILISVSLSSPHFNPYAASNCMIGPYKMMQKKIVANLANAK